MNDEMAAHLRDLKYDVNASVIDLPQQLSALLMSPISMINGCVLLEQMCDGAPDNLDDLKRCEYEYSENHFHPEDFVEGEIEDVDHLEI